MTTAELIAKLHAADPNGAGEICWNPANSHVEVMLSPTEYRQVMHLGAEIPPAFEPCASCPWPGQCADRLGCEAE